MQNLTAILESFFQQLAHVKKINISAQSMTTHSLTSKHATGSVNVLKPSDQELIFTEEGFWDNSKEPIHFTNKLRWSIDKEKKLISLEHLRHSVENPVFLFHFSLKEANKLISAQAHICDPDTYLGEITWSDKEIEYQCRVEGPKKNDLLIYRYT